MPILAALMRITGIFYALIGISLCMTLQTGCAGGTRPEETIPEKTLATATNVLNARCPEMVDKETRLDSVLLSQEGHLVYYYTLPNKDEPGINPMAFTAFLLPAIIDNVRSNPDLKMHRDSSITMVFIYRDRNGEFVTEIPLAPERYR